LLIAPPPPKEWYENREKDDLAEDYGLKGAMPYVESDPNRRDQLLDYLLDNFTSG
jgi:hypothetical protein